MLLLLVLLCALAASAQDAPRVNISQGVIVGSRVPDGDYLSFYGIHYGAPTSGENRFKAPREPLPYPGEYHAVHRDIICAQPSSRGIIGEENCLVVDIHTKNLTTPKPVLVWLEGEEYETTSKTLYSYKELVLEGLVVVSMNYRLSIFGFLCLGVPEAPGNAGLKDVVHGLKWIQANIAAFGGDPNKVTLLGHGSAGVMVDLTTMSPLAKGLFHNVMVLSGSSLAPWAVAYDPIGYATNFGAKLNYTGKNPSELATLLSTTDINILSSALNDSVFYNNSLIFAPCLENATLNRNETFLSDAPINILRSGNYIDVPYVAGFTNKEGTIRAKEAALDNWLPNMNVNFEKFLTVDLEFKSEEDKLNASRVIREFYFGKSSINMENIEVFLTYMGDVLIFIPVTRGVKERALTSNSTIWLYEFAYAGAQNSDWAYPQIPLNGVKHGGILNFLFNFDLKENENYARSAIIERVVNFVKTGSPHSTYPVAWRPITKTLMHTLYFNGGEFQPGDKIFREVPLKYPYGQQQIYFWSDIFNEYYKPLIDKPPIGVSSATSLLSLGVVVMITQIMIQIL